jgi:cyanophycinase
MGRLLVFLARLNEPNGKTEPPPGEQIRGIGVQEGAAVLLEADGAARVVGRGPAYFVDARLASGMLIGGKFGVSALHKPMTFGPYEVQKVEPGHAFNLKTWTGYGIKYQLNVTRGTIQSTQAGGAVY